MKRLFASTEFIHADSNGAVGVEASVVLSAYVLIALGSLGWAFLLWQLNSYQYSVQQSARCAAIINKGGSNLCGAFDTYGSSQTFGVPGVTSAYFSYQANTTAYTKSSGAATAPTSCVTANFINKLILALAGAPVSGSANFCRPTS